MTYRSGFSLIETIVAILIAAAATAVVLETMTASQRYAEVGEAQDDLSVGATGIMRHLAADLNGSGWLIPEFTLGISSSLTPVVATDRSVRYFPYVLSQRSTSSLHVSSAAPLGYLNRSPGLIIDPTELARRTLRIVSPQAPSGGTSFPAVLPVGDGTQMYDTTKTSWTMATEGSHYYNSFFAASQELVFARAAANPASWRNDAFQPDQGRRLLFNGTRAQWSSTAGHTALGILYPSGWKESAPNSGVFTPINDTDNDGMPDEPYGRLMETAVLDPTTLSLNLYWETVAEPTYAPQFPMTTDAAIDAIREYQYAVVPSTLGLGRLIRAMKIVTNAAPVTRTPEIGDCIASDGTFGMVVDQVLSDDVVRVVFDTYRTTSDDYTGVTANTNEQLGIDQIRVRLYMAKASSSRFDRGTIIYNIVDTTLTMRAKNSDALRIIDATQLGAQGVTYATR